MPWAPEGGCTWTLTPDGFSVETKDAVALRLVFNEPFDLEAFPPAAVGDKLIVRQKRGSSHIDTAIFAEVCEDSEACSFDWQTGECSDNGSCTFDEWTEPFVTSLHLTTDRNDKIEIHRGLDFDTLLVQQCEVETCADAGGTCIDGFCYCNNIACSCSCDDVGDVISTGVKIGIVLGVLAPVFACLLVGFYIYRRRKIQQSREQKKIIEEKEAELEQFRNSVVGMRAAISDYVPKASNDIKETARPPPKVQWCWKETDFCMDNHDEDDIFGSASDCWIKYGNSDQVEKAYQKQKGRGTFSPLTGYVLDFSTMVQTKQATGFEREREDGWAFGSKLHHENEALARKLLAVAVAVVGEGSSEDDAAILTDTGWFPLDKTQPPTGEELAVLQKQVGDTGELTPPKHWDPVVDPTTVQLHELREGDPERDAVWLWHGSNAEVMDKILQQGFNRSFCGKNATAYGKGVYFARDASYSAYRIYAVPDNKGIQYMMACRVVVGEYCKGHMDALTPDLRDASRNMLYDTTVGLLGSDNMSSPSIYVTYHDAQAYPEYLIAFKSSS
eukprot:scaffold5168_cov176-Amphora_coffeaeformis.AAC.5